jgi:hypothetical protein
MNDYNQHGQYFAGVFNNKPTEKQLQELDVLDRDIEQLLATGCSETSTNDRWKVWYLEQVKPQ